MEDAILGVKVLGATPHGIKNFSEESFVSNINSFYDHSQFNLQCTLNALDKLLEALEENKNPMKGLCKMKDRRWKC